MLGALSSFRQQNAATTGITGIYEEMAGNNLARSEPLEWPDTLSSGRTFFTASDRRIRHIGSFGIALLSASYMLLHPQLAAARLVIAAIFAALFAWLFLYFRFIVHKTRQGDAPMGGAAYVAIGFAVALNWLYGDICPELVLLFPATGLMPASGRSRRQGWGLTIAASVGAIATPWLAGRLKLPADWIGAAYAASVIALMLGSLTELQHHQGTRFHQQAQRLQRVETMAAVGSLATAAAHEIRNPLTTIKGFIQYMRHHDLVDARATEYLSMLEDDAERIAQTVDRFVGLGRPLVAAPTGVDAGAIVQRIVTELSEPALLVGIVFELQSLPAPHVWADPDMIGQAVRHVLQNSLEAMAGQSGRLTIRLSPGPTGYVTIRVHDTGPGMDLVQQGRAFDVFYTTKSGAGLGLPLVRRIMDAHGGDVRLVGSSRRHGTTVALIWPTETTFNVSPSA